MAARSDSAPGDTARVLAIGTYDTRVHPRAAVVMAGLRRRGLQVEECNLPLGLDTAARVDLLQRPWKLPLLAGRLVTRWVRIGYRSRRMAPPDVILVPYMGHFDVHLARLLFRRRPIVLDHLVSGRGTAVDRRAAGRFKQRLLGALDAAALRAADLVMVDTDEHLAVLPVAAQAKAVVVPVGAEDAWAAPSRQPYDGSRPLRVVFFGLFTPLQGATVIGAALGLLADDDRVEATMIGDGQDREESRRAAAPNPRVTWCGLMPSDELPAVVAGHDVCLGIFGDGDKARRVVPNKVYQGLRAGCAVVTSDTTPQRRTLGEAAAFVPVADPAALAATLREMAATPAAVADLQLAARALSDRFAPEGVVVPLIERLPALRSRPA